MPFYHRVGEVPKVKHTTFYKPDGKSLYREELFSSKGFSGVYSNKYHINMPTKVVSVKELDWHKDVSWPEAPVLYLHFFTDKKPSEGNFITARNEFLHNPHCVISAGKVTEDTDLFYRNAYGAEYVFIHHGSGVLYSEFGKLPFEPGDQIVIPRAVTYQLKFDKFDNNKILICESDTAYEIPKHFRNEYGQFEEHAPYGERDFKVPEFNEPSAETGDFKIIVKAKERYFEHIVPHHPFDVVGWDGYLYPYAINIKSYHAKVGRIHLPPPTHLLLNTQHFVLCNFVPRPFDFHPNAIPAPYWHSNIDSDEVLYYVEG
ncbi:homogentisate 1,2-dioxygenase, partial [candidate division GN15 bacterium]|nr:homogentisate 1,2-dioxygenase [candidate division GN15 bacterium]